MDIGLAGLRIHWSEYATQDGEPETVRYSWRRRLLSWPWRPWCSTYTVIPKVPAMYQAGHLLIVHPALRSKLLEAFPLRAGVDCGGV